MNEKEVAELRRRFRPDRIGISRVCGCCVNEKGEIVSDFRQSLDILPETESEEILTRLKKTLSGSLGKNLVDISFSTQAVLEGEEHKLLADLRDSGLEDDAALMKFYEKVIASVHLEGNYLILLAADAYDVFAYGKDGKREEDSTSVFRYILCSICPVKMTKPALSFSVCDNAFHTVTESTLVAPPECGFLFPAFDNRAANIYGALYYTRDAADSRAEFVNAVFGGEVKVPMAATVQKETFCSILSESVAEACSLDVVQGVKERLSDLIEEHKGNKEEPLLLSADRMTDVLRTCGVEDEQAEVFHRKYEENFGEKAEMRPQNLMETKRFEMKTPDVTIKVNPDRGDLITTQTIDGLPYILIRADGDVEVNGVNIHIQ